jgi:hypothetical protein
VWYFKCKDYFLVKINGNPALFNPLNLAPEKSGR